MSEYTIEYRGFTWCIVQGERLIGTAQAEGIAATYSNILNEETAPLHETIEAQTAEIAKQGERIKALEKFIHDIAESAMPEKEVNQALLFRATVRDAKTFMEQSPAPETVAAPKFAVGQKVRVTPELYLENYENGDYDTITKIVIAENAPPLYALRYFDDNPRHNHNADWEEDELIPYTEESASE